MFAKTFDCLTMKEKFAGIIYFLWNESTNSVQQELHTSPKKKKKWRQVKHAKQSGEILSLTTCSVHYLPLNTHMFNLCPMTSESPTSFRLCVSRSTICTSLSSLYYSVNCAMLTSRKPAPWR